jgi:glycerol-3-phosphate acyltransferase PlsY
MDIGFIILAAVVGYLAGSISFARLFTKILKPDQDLNAVEIPYDSGGGHTMAAVGATTASLVLGPKWGMIITLCDLLKALIPALVFRLVFPSTYYYMFAGGAAIVGHIWPIYYRFRGGYGISPVLGSFLVLDPLGVLVSNAVAMFLGFVVFKEFAIVMLAGTWLMILWVWLVGGDVTAVLFTIIANLLLATAAIPELIRHLRDRKQGKVSMNELMKKFPMGRMTEKMMGKRKTAASSDPANKE